MTNEEIYLFQKLFRTVFHTNNVDHGFDGAPGGTRPTRPFGAVGAPPGGASGFPLGFDAATGSIVGLERAEVILLVGANPTVHQPVLSLRIRKAIGRGARLIVVGSERIDLTREASRVVRTAPGGETAVLVAVLRALATSDRHNAEFVGARTRGFDELKAQLAGLSPDTGTAADGGVSAEVVERVSAMLAGKRLAILYPRARGVGPDGEALVAAIANLALLTGSLGRDGAGVYPLVDHANSQGALDLGALPDRLPGHRGLEAADDLARVWNATIPSAPGIDGGRMLAGEVRGLYLVGADPIGANRPGAREALGKLSFLVVQDHSLTETARLANVVLPGLTYAEKEGTFTNLERRVQRLRVATQVRGEARPDWRIIQDVANWLGGRFLYTSTEDVFAEITLASPIYAGLTYSRIGLKGVQWPYSQSNGSGSRVLYGDESTAWDFVPLPSLVR